MSDHKTGTREEWQAAHQKLVEQEKELAERSGELAAKRRQLPWVPVEKDYTFDTDEGQKTLAELFDGRAQLVAYHIMFGPDYTLGACPGCPNLADHFDAGVIHLNHRDVTFVAISRAPLERIQAYKRRMGWRFPWISSHGSDYQFDFGFAFTPEQMQADVFQQMIREAPDWLTDWSVAVGADLEKGLAEGPGWAVFAFDDGVVHHTYSRHAPDGALLAPYYYQLLDQTPRGRGDEFRATRHDEYEDAAVGQGG
jgi:predicted dithiol-disulfide oxidoreductase (DUF899 family)